MSGDPVIVKGATMNVLADFNSLFEILSTPVLDFGFNPSIICITKSFVIK